MAWEAPRAAQAVAAALRAVIVTHNHREEAALLLADLAAAGGICPVVVDEASEDGTIEAVREKVEAMGGRVVVSKENLGYAHGVNAGAAADLGPRHEEAILILNPDLRLPPEAPAILAESLRKDKRLAAVGPAFVDGRGFPLPSWYHAPRTATAVLEAAGGFVPFEGLRRRLRARRPRAERPGADERVLRLLAPGASLVGAAMCVSRAAWKKIGPFDEDFFLYHEETDWCLRAARAGYLLGVREDVSIGHEGGDTIEKLSPERFADYLRGRIRLEVKHRGETPARRLAQYLRAALALRAFLGPRAARARRTLSLL